jgi:hypothetical protein
MFATVTAKLGTQRKAQTYTVMPTSDGKIMVQSDKAIGEFYPQTGKGMLNIKGSYYPYLSRRLGAVEYQFPADFVAECVRVCPTPGETTSLAGGVVLMHNTVQVVSAPLPGITEAQRAAMVAAGRAQYLRGGHRAPALDATVTAAIAEAGSRVGDGTAVALMSAYTAGFDAAADEAAQRVLDETDETDPR